jgi:hypothetical protein
MHERIAHGSWLSKPVDYLMSQTNQSCFGNGMLDTTVLTKNICLWAASPGSGWHRRIWNLRQVIQRGNWATASPRSLACDVGHGASFLFATQLPIIIVAGSQRLYWFPERLAMTPGSTGIWKEQRMSLELVRGNDVARLNNHELRSVLNSLLTADACQNHVALGDLHLTTRDTDPDEGIDGRIKWPRNVPHDLLQAGENVVQYKSGKLSETQLKTEFQKPGVQSVLKAGGFYLMCVGHDYTPTTIGKLQKTLKTLCRRRKIPSERARIVFGGALARWICRYPAVVILPELKKNMPEFVTVERWEKENPQLSTPFRFDETRAATIQEMRDFLDSKRQESVLRLEGPAGVGKTRLALEAVLDSKYAGRTVYALNADSQKVQDFLSAAYADPDTFALVVVDECDTTRQSVLAQYTENSNGRLKLICVGISEILYDAPPPVLTPVYQLKPLADQDIEAILQESFAGAPNEFIAVSVRLANGYVKLAMFIMQVLARYGAQPPVKLVEVQDIRVFLQKFVDSETRKSLQVLSLLARIGWEEDLQTEAQTVAKFVRLPFAKLQAATKKLRDLGVVVPRGRYLYVSPDLLAVKAAADLWDERGPQLIELIHKLQNREPRRQLLRRLAMMGEHKEVRRAVESILSKKGLYPSLKELDDPLLSEIFRILSSAAPIAATDLLIETVFPALESELLDFNTGRRDVIWAIESLLRWPETSLRAARVLTKLALFETEKFANNATGILSTYFHVFLSGSPLPLMERFVLIDEVLHSGHSQSRQLAVRLARSSLESFESRGGGNVDNLSKRPFPREWQPKTYGEIWEARRKALSFLEQIAQGDDETAASARRERLQAIPALIGHGQIEDAIRILETATTRTDEDRRMIMDSCETLISVPNLGHEQIARVQQVRDAAFGQTYFDRLRRWVGIRLNSDFDMEGTSGFDAADKRAIQLAEEGFQNGIGASEMNWLASPEAQNVWPYGKRLGLLDRKGVFWERIIQATPDDINCMLLVSYLDGRAAVIRTEERESLVEELSHVKPNAAFGATWRGEPTAAGAERIIRLVTTRRVEASTMRVLMYGGWVEKLPPEYATRIVNLMLRTDAAGNVEAVLGIIDHAVQTKAVSVVQFGEAIWTALQSKPGRRSPSFGWHWGRVADLVAASNSTRFAQVFVTLFESDETWLHTEFAQGALRLATEADPGGVWNIIGATLLREDLTSVRLQLKLDHWYGELIPAELLVDWARQHGKRAFLVAASLLNLKSGRPSDSARRLVAESHNPDQVLNRLFASLSNGVFTGPMSTHMEQQLGTLKLLAEDEEPRIRDWAQSALTRVETAVQRQKLVEDEEEL